MTSQRSTWLFLAIGLAGTSTMAAQSQQRFSIQGTGVYVVRRAAGSNDVTENRRTAGGEAQLRYTFPLSRLSVGVGYQVSSVRSGFIEPRVVVTASELLALYLSGRAGFSKLVCTGDAPCAAQKMEQLLGVGGGMLVQASSRVALDFGTAYQFVYYTPVGAGQLRSRTGWFQLRGGISIGL